MVSTKILTRTGVFDTDKNKKRYMFASILEWFLKDHVIVWLKIGVMAAENVSLAHELIAF